MKVECNTIKEFFDCLDSEKHLFQHTIRVSINRRPLGSGDPHVVFEVIFQASAVILVDEEYQYVLEVGFSCGKDYDEENGSLAASDLAAGYRTEIEDYAESRKWKVLPGIISI